MSDAVELHFPLPCIVCGRALEPANPSLPTDYGSPPMRGLTFLSYGNYGSQLFDPADNSRYLQISVCDDCIRSDPQMVAEVRVQRTERAYEVKMFQEES